MDDGFPLEDDVLLTGTLVVQAVGRVDRKPLSGRRVKLRACGFV